MIYAAGGLLIRAWGGPGTAVRMYNNSKNILSIILRTYQESTPRYILAPTQDNVQCSTENPLRRLLYCFERPWIQLHLESLLLLLLLLLLRDEKIPPNSGRDQLN